MLVAAKPKEKITLRQGARVVIELIYQPQSRECARGGQLVFRFGIGGRIFGHDPDQRSHSLE
jgi:hypothetical protein